MESVTQSPTRPAVSHAVPSFVAPGIVVLALLLLAAWPRLNSADDSPSVEDRVKAAIVYKLTKFVDWPATSFASGSTPLTLCVLGRGTIAAALSAVEGRVARNRTVTFRRIDGATAGEDSCHLLFIAPSATHRVDGLLQGLRARPVLTVSDIEGFAERGGIVGLIRSGSRVRFAINLDAARRAGLSISAPLLEMATVVREES